MVKQLGVKARFTLLYGIALIITVLFVSGGIYFRSAGILGSQYPSGL